MSPSKTGAWVSQHVRMCPAFPGQALYRALYLLLSWAPGSESQNARRRQHSQGFTCVPPFVNRQFSPIACVSAAAPASLCEAGSSAVVWLRGHPEPSNVLPFCVSHQGQFLWLAGPSLAQWGMAPGEWVALPLPSL